MEKIKNLDLDSRISLYRNFLVLFEKQVVTTMLDFESFVEDENSHPELLDSYNTLGFVLASVRDILKELDGYESTDNV